MYINLYVFHKVEGQDGWILANFFFFLQFMDPDDIWAKNK